MLPSIISMILGILCSKFPKTVRFDILYEQEIRPSKNNFTAEVLNRILEDYNSHLSEVGIKFLLNSIMDYKQYSNLKEYRVYSKLVGSDDLEKRKSSLDKIHKNLIIIYSSLEKKDKRESSIVNSCKDRVFLNIRNFEAMPDEVIQISLESIKKYMGDLLKIEIPEFYQLENILIPESAKFEGFNSLISPEVIGEINDCLADNIIAEKMFLNDNLQLSSRAYVFKDGSKIKSYLNKAKRSQERNFKQYKTIDSSPKRSKIIGYNFKYGSRWRNLINKTKAPNPRKLNFKKRLSHRANFLVLNEQDDANRIEMRQGFMVKCPDKKNRMMMAKPDDGYATERLLNISSNGDISDCYNFVNEKASDDFIEPEIIRKRIVNEEYSGYLNNDAEMLKEKEIEMPSASSSHNNRRFAMYNNKKQAHTSSYVGLKRRNTPGPKANGNKYSLDTITYLSDDGGMAGRDSMRKRQDFAKKFILPED